MDAILLYCSYMDTLTTINADEVLVIPKKMLAQFPGAKRFEVKPVEGALVIEPADDADTHYTLTKEEKLKLEQSTREPSLPLSALKE